MRNCKPERSVTEASQLAVRVAGRVAGIVKSPSELKKLQKQLAARLRKAAEKVESIELDESLYKESFGGWYASVGKPFQTLRDQVDPVLERIENSLIDSELTGG